MATTITGRICQRWVSFTPHQPSAHVVPKNFPDGSVEEAGNKCRNPDREPEGPWCYTMDPALRWEYCDLPMCPGWLYNIYVQNVLLQYRVTGTHIKVVDQNIF